MAAGQDRLRSELAGPLHIHGNYIRIHTLLLQAYITPANLHTASVNSICWAPYELGLILACASSDGAVSLIEYKSDGSWETTKVRSLDSYLARFREAPDVSCQSGVAGPGSVSRFCNHPASVPPPCH